MRKAATIFVIQTENLQLHYGKPSFKRKPFEGKMSLSLSNSLSFSQIRLVKIGGRNKQTLNHLFCYFGVFAQNVLFYKKIIIFVRGFFGDQP